MESPMKVVKVEGAYPLAFQTEVDVAEHLRRYNDAYNAGRGHPPLE